MFLDTVARGRGHLVLPYLVRTWVLYGSAPQSRRARGFHIARTVVLVILPWSSDNSASIILWSVYSSMTVHAPSLQRTWQVMQ
jgi:hypothetical protein